MKNLKQPYPEPALVPLGEKPKMWEFNLVQGIRQISPVSSVQGIPAFVSVWVRVQGAVTKVVRLFNKNLTFREAVKLCMEGDICPVPVL